MALTLALKLGGNHAWARYNILSVSAPTEFSNKLFQADADFFIPSQILYQIHFLMRAGCSPSVIPQSSVRFQCRSGFWATNVDLGESYITVKPKVRFNRKRKHAADWLKKEKLLF